MTKEFWLELISKDGTSTVLNDRDGAPIYFDEVNEALEYGGAVVEHDYPEIVCARVIDIERKRAVSSVMIDTIALPSFTKR